MSGLALETKDLTIRFGGHVAVDDVSCAIHPGELTAIVGPNGAGKTTFFNLVSGQLRPSAGSISFAGRDLTGMAPDARAKLGLGRSFQLTNLFPALTVEQNLHLVVQGRRGAGLSMLSIAKEDRDTFDEVAGLMERCRLSHLADTEVHALAHGEQRKLEVAMLIAMKPMVFMFDEPTAGMSGDEVPDVLNLIKELKADKDCIIMLVEHKIDVIFYLADRIIVLHEGRLVADGSPKEVMESPIVSSVYLGEPIDGEGQEQEEAVG